MRVTVNDAIHGPQCGQQAFLDPFRPAPSMGESDAKATGLEYDPFRKDLADRIEIHIPAYGPVLHPRKHLQHVGTDQVARVKEQIDAGETIFDQCPESGVVAAQMRVRNDSDSHRFLPHKAARL
jgi:hypothetical protein